MALVELHFEMDNVMRGSWAPLFFSRGNVPLGMGYSALLIYAAFIEH